MPSSVAIEEGPSERNLSNDDESKEAVSSMRNAQNQRLQERKAPRREEETTVAPRKKISSLALLQFCLYSSGRVSSASMISPSLQ
uniref:Uncharacterized protein n=1 Tax=Haemonchus contortus TaxID=6289 RepID=W6NW92_HAECO